MTGDTVAHVHLYQSLARRLGHLSHAAMAFLAPQFANRDVPVVREVHMHGILIQPFPGYILLLLDIVDQFYFFGTFRDRVFAMAAHADLDIRQSGGSGSEHSRMAFLAFEYFRVDLVAVGQRLFYGPGKKFIPPESHERYYEQDKYAKHGFLYISHRLIPLSLCCL